MTTIPKRSPWGTIDSHDVIAPGIVSVSTPSHGGIKLDRTRNAVVHPAFRTVGGWYEEDCQANVAVYFFPNEFAAWARANDRDPAFWTRETAAKSLREWSPDEWSAMTGETVTAAESQIVRRREFLAAHAADWVVISAVAVAVGDGDAVKVTCTVGGDPSSTDRAVFMVPTDEYREVRNGSFVADPKRHARMS